jgi:hypothetical protein
MDITIPDEAPKIDINVTCDFFDEKTKQQLYVVDFLNKDTDKSIIKHLPKENLQQLAVFIASSLDKHFTDRDDINIWFSDRGIPTITADGSGYQPTWKFEKD